MLQVCFDCYGSYTTDSVYQWDLNRRLAIRGLDYDSAPAIHFSNKKSTEALVVQSTIEDGVIYCDVPNILLQESYDIVGYVCECLDQELTTYETIRIPVKPRVKPADYAYSDNVEILTYYSLMAEISSVKASTEKEVNSMNNQFNAVKAEIDSDLAKVENDLSKVEGEVATERARIDQLVASPEIGEGDLEKEVGDLRVDIKGTTHGSAGTAVREQILELSSKIENKTSFAEVVCDIVNPKDIVENHYYGSPNVLNYMAGWLSVEVKVEPNTIYSNANFNSAFTWLLDENKESIGSFVDILGYVSTFTTPNNCHYIQTCYNGKSPILINKGGYYASHSKGYLVPIETEIPTLKNVSVGAENVLIDNSLVATIYNYVNDSATVTSFENGILTQEYSGNNNGWWSVPFSANDITSNFVFLRTKIDSLVGGIRVFLRGYSTGGETLYLSLYDISNVGEHNIDIDLNYYVVYRDLDLSKDLSILFANKTTELKAVYSKADIFDRITLLDTEKNLLENLNEMSTGITSAKAMAQSATSNIKLLGSDGEKYYLQVSNGQLAVSPVIPSNILYIGNSLLIGWGTFGMASSNSSEDYFAYVNDYLTKQGKTVTASKMSGGTFEGCTSADAQNAWLNGTLLPKLNANLDLVIIQLGDNVNTEGKLAVFEQGAKNLVRFIREHAPNARVAWVGEWYSSATKQMYIANACATYGAVFVDISDLPNVSGNKANIGDIVTKDDGSTITIDSSGVASHPSSQGMLAIANRIIETLF